MARKTVCLLRSFDPGQGCNGQPHEGHWHIRLADAYALCREGVAQWVMEPQRRCDPAVIAWTRRLALRGFSARFGETLAEALRRREPWAETLLSDIRLERLSRRSQAMPGATEEAAPA